jgi:hypothetical protein
MASGESDELNIVQMLHEDYIRTIRDIAVHRLNETKIRENLLAAKLTYAAGQPGVRGRCFHQAWESGERHEFIEVCAAGEESPVQIAGTTIHELAHCIAGALAGHGRDWKVAAKQLGLLRAQAAGQEYHPKDFDPDVWTCIQAVPSPSDGQPAFALPGQMFLGAIPKRAHPCPLGIGTRGGRSRGRGSGSRLRLYVCACTPPVRVRVARDEDHFHARCLDCDSPFKRADTRSS